MEQLSYRSTFAALLLLPLLLLLLLCACGDSSGVDTGRLDGGDDADGATDDAGNAIDGGPTMDAGADAPDADGGPPANASSEAGASEAGLVDTVVDAGPPACSADSCSAGSVCLDGRCVLSPQGRQYLDDPESSEILQPAGFDYLAGVYRGFFPDSRGFGVTFDAEVATDGSLGAWYGGFERIGDAWLANLALTSQNRLTLRVAPEADAGMPAPDPRTWVTDPYDVASGNMMLRDTILTVRLSPDLSRIEHARALAVLPRSEAVKEEMLSAYWTVLDCLLVCSDHDSWCPSIDDPQQPPRPFPANLAEVIECNGGGPDTVYIDPDTGEEPAYTAETVFEASEAVLTFP